ncbi:MAG: CopG family transcriptional regulator [Rhodanobacter sp.]|nr:MAG: CopG family transcriptional regulator [Rhodanobacter sp.]TAM38350.1 MAG: CopG family transcriptional regulator [Rhodanobacter sp.]
MPIEKHTARLTILIDPRKKAVFEHLCAGEDTTPSQVVRRLIREYIEQKSGRPWHATEAPTETATPIHAGPLARRR